jgi:hypothetical protein
MAAALCTTSWRYQMVAGVSCSYIDGFAWLARGQHRLAFAAPGLMDKKSRAIPPGATRRPASSIMLLPGLLLTGIYTLKRTTTASLILRAFFAWGSMFMLYRRIALPRTFVASCTKGSSPCTLPLIFSYVCGLLYLLNLLLFYPCP